MTKICVVSKAVTLKPEHVSESPGGFVKAEIVRACLRDSGSVGLRYSKRICISTGFLDDVAAGPGATL